MDVSTSLTLLVGLALLAGQEPAPDQDPGQQAGEETQAEPPPEPPVRFRVNVLGDPGAAACDLGAQAVAINARGEAVGRVCRPDRTRAAFWSIAGELTLLDDPEQAANSFAVDVDDEGTVLGFVLDASGPRPFLWSADTSPIWLGLPEGAEPVALGAERQVAFSFKPDDRLVGAILDGQGQPIVIASPDRDVLVRDVNADDVVTGIVGDGTSAARAFRWSRAGGLVELPVPEGFTHTHGNAIAADGLVVGLSRTGEREAATVWSPEGELRLLPYADEQSTQGGALGVNADRWIVGYEHATVDSFARARAVVWIDGVAWELDRLLLPHHAGEVHVTVAWDVNDQGWIAARGTLEGVQRALRLVPE